MKGIFLDFALISLLLVDVSAVVVDKLAVISRLVLCMDVLGGARVLNLTLYGPAPSDDSAPLIKIIDFLCSSLNSFFA